MIPKIIHYVWLGEKPFSKSEKKCLESWQKHCVDYKFILWNEKNFNISKYKFAKEAYENKKFAFVSDFIRLFVLYKYGGIYLDTDMELIMPIEDNFLKNDGFCGFEDCAIVSCGIIGACKSNNHIKRNLDVYMNTSFVLKDKKLNIKPITSRLTSYFKSIGLKQVDKTQNIDGFKIYSSDYFYPIRFYGGKNYFTNNTIGIHHWSGSWMQTKEKRYYKIKRFISKFPLTYKTISHIRKIFKNE